jgi:hexosaminidase
MQCIRLTKVITNLLILLSTLTINNQVSIAQGKIETSVTVPSFSWEINGVGAQVQPVLKLNISETKGLSAKAWSIYFNSIKKPFISKEDLEKFVLTKLNGDLYNLKPLPGLALTNTQKEVRLNLSVPEIRNYTELPTGFYLVFNDAPEKGHSLRNTSIPFGGIEPEIALRSYKTNASFANIDKIEPSLIFPSPVSLTLQKGFFILKGELEIATAPAFTKEARLLGDELAEILGKKPVIKAKKSKTTAISLEIGTAGEEGYSLECNQNGITIRAAEASGIFYGIQSLKTLFPPTIWSSVQQQIEVPAVSVSDAPRFKHRALLIDVARNFQPKENIYKVLDLMAIYKMNVLHFHLVDDEGWRVEIDGLPELTSVGGKRGHSLDVNKMLPPSYGSGPSTENSFGTGYYSKEDYIAILKYATLRYITVIPEIESPGHARAAIKSMDARYAALLKMNDKKNAEAYLLRDLKDGSIYHSVQGWTDNVMNPALPSTYHFIKKVTSELVKIYKEANAPLKTIHMGGDEVPEGVWTKSPMVNKLIASDGKVKDAYGMWTYYFTKVNAILKEQNLSLSSWEEVGLKKTLVNGKGKWVMDPEVSQNGYTLDVWNNIIGTGAEDLAYRLANQGFKVVLSNVTNNYLDMAYNNSFYEHGMNWAGFVNVDKPFYFNPLNYYLTTTENEYGHSVPQEFFKNKELLNGNSVENIVGLQAALWSETIVKDGLLEYLLLPKILGAAERAWAKAPEWATISDPIFESNAYKSSWNTFTATIGLRELPRLDHYMGGFQYRIPEPGVEKTEGVVKANVQLPGFIIRYTTDGTEPTASSEIYSKPVPAKGTVTLKVFNGAGRSGKKVTVSAKND